MFITRDRDLRRAINIHGMRNKFLKFFHQLFGILFSAADHQLSVLLKSLAEFIRTKKRMDPRWCTADTISLCFYHPLCQQFCVITLFFVCKKQCKAVA